MTCKSCAGSRVTHVYDPDSPVSVTKTVPCPFCFMACKSCELDFRDCDCLGLAEHGCLGCGDDCRVCGCAE